MRRIDKISSFIVMDIYQEAQRIDDVIHMEIGEPDLDPPPGVIENLNRAIRERKYFYTPSLGIWELREKIAEHYKVYYGVEVSPERIVITTGTSGAFLVAYAILTSQGDKVVLADPSYPCYKNFAHLLDVEPVFVPVDASTNYQILPEMIEDLDFNVLHISSPSNPTGTIYSEENLKKLIELCERKGAYFISDEIYHGLVYEGKETTALQFSDSAIVISGFSKFFCMPGFRLGWMVLPEHLVRSADVVIQNVYISAPALSQYAALGAFDYEYLSRVREIYRRRKDILYEGLKDVFNIEVKPEGAFYIWARIDRYSTDSYNFSLELLRKARVAVTPGVDFGFNKTNLYIRFSYTKDEDALREGIQRIKDYLTR
ncbi:pyridoxal phosphate-dependent aminotransferase [Thermocrinis minervae]|uniref:Aspartate/methionine/tyrosine aminotransferase n=1 Tax=Thermocrinis minervae TaxID=381751 RepID=A0A1M6TIL5_9AQUI|nr:aminotransferase class I/II-fold pyridoxal phosphate-dependent enzyme [Thermocrinis minervae]SHK56811.1 Aspartate/methionine/tyrosine aminotransferase [Thermocrinis minervae]